LEREKDAILMFDQARAYFGRRGDSNQVVRLNQLIKELDPLGILLPESTATNRPPSSLPVP
jgi:hypothetical protein